jgi:hypothetical protein
MTMSPKKSPKKNETKKKAPRPRAAAPASDATFTPAPGVQLPARLPYVITKLDTKEVVAGAVIDLYDEVADLRGNDAVRIVVPVKAYAKGRTADALRNAHSLALAQLVAERVATKQADEEEAARAKAEAEAAAPKPKVTRQRTPRASDQRMPAVGTVLTKTREGTTVTATVVEGGVDFDGRTYRSLSSAALAAAAKLGLCSKAQNGFAFWGLAKSATPRRTTLTPEAVAKQIAALGEQISKTEQRLAALKAKREDLCKLEQQVTADAEVEAQVAASAGELLDVIEETAHEAVGVEVWEDESPIIDIREQEAV